MNRIYSKIAEIEMGSRRAVLCTVVVTKGSTPRKAGAKMIVYENGKIYGTIGGGNLEKKIIEKAVEVVKNREATIVKHNLVGELAMCCGGTVEIFIEPIMNKKKLYIFGAGHIGKALAGFANELDFVVSLIDERYDAFDDFNNEEVIILKEHHNTAIERLTFDENTYVVVVTHDHQYDREILSLTMNKNHGYLGMIGSQRKVEVAKKNLVASGLQSEAELEGVNMPIGLDINAKTPEEIAVSILAQLISVRNK